MSTYCYQWFFIVINILSIKIAYLPLWVSAKNWYLERKAHVIMSISWNFHRKKTCAPYFRISLSLNLYLTVRLNNSKHLIFKKENVFEVIKNWGRSRKLSWKWTVTVWKSPPLAAVWKKEKVSAGDRGLSGASFSEVFETQQPKSFL